MYSPTEFYIMIVK